MPGGKQKQAQRTKGNVKPSSSGRAAELLAASGGGKVNLVGFQALDVCVPGDEVDSSVDPDFRMVLRKFMKKDTVTKLKTLQEFQALCKEKDTEVLTEVLPYWPRLYNKLALDNDRRVRESVQLAFEALVLPIRRSLAPHLRSVMATWLLAQNEPGSQASVAARRCFQAVFPPNKQTDVIIHCKDEIFNHIKDNLLCQTVSTLSDGKTPKEEAEARYTRVMTSSLGALRHVVTMETEKRDVFKEHLEEILKEQKFWKLAKHPVAQIRSGFYSLLSALCQHQSSLAGQYADRLCPSVLHRLDDTDTAVTRALWDAVIAVIGTGQSCWDHVSVRKAVIPQLWTVLRGSVGQSPGCGSSPGPGPGWERVVCPALLPLVSRLPPDVATLHFHQDLLSRLNVGQPSHDVTAVVTAYMECLRYAVSRYLDNDDVTSAKVLLDEQLVPVLRTSLTAESGHLHASPLYSQLVMLLGALNREPGGAQEEPSVTERAPTDEKSLQSPHSLLETHFWTTFAPLCHQCLQTPDFPLSRLSDLLHNFKRKRKTPDKHCLKLVCQLCCSAFKTAKEKTSLPHIDFLSRTLAAFQTAELVEEILKIDSDEGQGQGQGDVCLHFCAVTLIPWIGRLADSGSHGLRGLMELLVSVHQMTSQQQTRDAILDLVTQRLESAHVLYEAMRAFRPYRDSPAVHRWFLSPPLGDRLVTITRNICTDIDGQNTDSGITDPTESAGVADLEKTDLSDSSSVADSEDSGEDSSWKLVRLALTFDEKFEPLIHAEHVNAILRCLTSALARPAPSGSAPSTSPASKTVELICGLARHLMTNVQMAPEAEDLLFVLFTLSLNNNAFSESLANQIRCTWLAGVTALTNQRGGYVSEGGFFDRAAKCIRSILCFALSNQEIDRVVMVTKELLQCVHDCVSGEKLSVMDTPIVREFISSIRLKPNFNDQSWTDSVLLEGQIPVSPPLLAPLAPPPPPSLSSQLSTLLGYQRLLESLGDDVTVAVTSSLLDEEVVEDVTVALAWMKARLGSRARQLMTSELGVAYKRLTKDHRRLVEGLDDAGRQKLAQTLVKRSLSEGGVVALSLPLILEQCHYDVMTDLQNVDWYKCCLADVQTVSACVPQLSQYALLETALRFMDDVNLDPGAENNQKLSWSLLVLRRCLEQAYLPCGQESSQLDDVTISLLNTIIQWKLEDRSLDNANSEETWRSCFVLVEVVRIWTCVVRSPALLAQLSAQHWDFLLCNLATWTQKIDVSQLATVRPHLLTSSHVLTLLYHCAAAMTKVVPELESAPETLLQEWNEFFSDACYKDMLDKYLVLLGNWRLEELYPREDHLVRAYSQALTLTPRPRLSLPPRLSPDSHLPQELQTSLGYLCPLLASQHRSVQITAYTLINRLVPELPGYDEGHEAESDSMDDVARSPPAALIDVLRTSGALLEVLLEDLSPCESIVIEPETQAFTLTLSYLLSWRLVLAFFKAASSELRAEYATYLKRESLISELMAHLLHLLPDSPVIHLTEMLTRQPPETGLRSSASMFSQPPILNPAASADESEICHVACQVLYTALEDLPAVIRQWLNNQNKQTASHIDRYTAKYASPILCHQEISSVHDSALTFDNMQVKTRPAAREVCAIYTVDDVSMEIVVVLPSNYPFGVVTVETGRRVGVATAQWRNWMLQMTTILNHQNGSIVEGLCLWKRNIDKKFEGVEDCMICFSVIHGANCQLPRQLCKTCKKKFHSACLYKWFNTSNNTACPLCRNLF